MSTVHGRHFLWLSLLTVFLAIYSEAYPNTSTTSVHDIRVDRKYGPRGRYNPRFLHNHETSDPKLRMRDMQGRYRRQDQITRFSGICEKVYTPDGNSSQTCCQPDQSKDEWHCLPKLILVGAQKSGTTALFAYLLDHPEFRAGILRKGLNETEVVDTKNRANKELHFFDNPFKISQSMTGYLTHFQAIPKHLRSSYINGDLSPSYMVKYTTLQHIQSMLPDAKLIVMVRDPVLRAWSEIQMKIRQDIGRCEWKRMLESNSHVMYNCVVSLGAFTSMVEARTTHHFQSCLPSEVVSNIRWRRFMRFSLGPALAKTDHGRNYSSLIDPKDGLFVRHGNGSIGIRLNEHFIPPASFPRPGFSNQDPQSKVGNHRFRGDLTGRPVMFVARQLEEEQAKEEEEDGASMHGIRLPRSRKTGNNANPNAIPNSKAMENEFQAVPPETLSPFLSVQYTTSLLTKERNTLTACLETDPYLRTCATSTLRTSSDLSRAHLTRGMYYAQVSNLYSLFPKAQILVIETEELKRDPVNVMNRVFRFVGMNVREQKNQNSKNEKDGDDNGFRVLDNGLINEVIQKAMPGFASLSGWGNVKKDKGGETQGGEGEQTEKKKNGNEREFVALGEMRVESVEDVDRLILPVDLREMLAEFFEPQNDKLFGLIGRSFDHWIVPQKKNT